jgi:hypothetical protein
VVTSRYSDAERAAILAEARALLEPTAGERADVVDAEEAWPRRGPLIPVRSTAAMDRWRAEQIALEAERQDERERQRAATERREQHLLTQRMQTDASWNAWADRKIRAALAEHDATHLDAIAKFVAEFVGKAIDELRDEMRAELLSATRSDKAGQILDLPALPPRRGHAA